MAMTMANVYSSVRSNPSLVLLFSSSTLTPISTSLIFPNGFPSSLLTKANGRRTVLLRAPLATKKQSSQVADDLSVTDKEVKDETPETFLYSTSLPLLFVAALPGAGTVRSLFGPFVELVKSWNLPEWLVHWGHPGNMAVVLFAMGGYGTYLGFRIRFSDDVEEKAKAKDLHPKLLAGMFFFFALGATGGVVSLLTSDKPIFESPHAVTGLIGLSLLTAQTLLPTLFEGNPGLRNVHGILGSGIMTLFLVHAALGLQLGLSS